MSDYKDLQSDSPSISWPLSRPAHQSSFSGTQPKSDHTGLAVDSTSTMTPVLNKDIFPGRQKALDGISLRAFLLGITLGLSALSTVLIAYNQQQIWRAPFFLMALSLFHFLEFYVTAAYNTPAANISAFLLSQNGKAYNLAHTAAFTESVLTSLFFPQWQASFSTSVIVSFGFAAMLVGQITRSVAMAHAGTNFNHTVQTRKAAEHELVTTGIYSYLRHPSYFGFFWWGLGTQMVLGNLVCFLAYTFILWSFFSSRIQSEYSRFCKLLSQLTA